MSEMSSNPSSMSFDEVEGQAHKRARREVRNSKRRHEMRQKRLSDGPQANADTKSRKDRASGNKIRAAFLNMLSQFDGFTPVPKGTEATPDAQGVEYCSLRDKRNKKAVVKGLREFIAGSNMSFVVDMLRKENKITRRAAIKEFLMSFVKDSKAVLGYSDVQEKMGIKSRSMSFEDAVVLFYAGNYSYAQWDAMAASVNKLMDTELRKAIGRYSHNPKRYRGCIHETRGFEM
jgi:hypothetical protein